VKASSVIFVPHITTKENFNRKSDYPKVSNILACLSEITVRGRLIYDLENWRETGRSVGPIHNKRWLQIKISIIPKECGNKETSVPQKIWKF
jgi:hypothetical protein